MKQIKSIGILMVVFLMSSCTIGYGEKKVFEGTEVFYLDSVTEEKATQLGNFLVKTQFTDGTKKSVQLSRDESNNRLTFKMVALQEAVNDPKYDKVFRGFKKELETEFNEDVDFYLTDSTFKTIKVYD